MYIGHANCVVLPFTERETVSSCSPLPHVRFPALSVLGMKVASDVMTVSSHSQEPVTFTTLPNSQLKSRMVSHMTNFSLLLPEHLHERKGGCWFEGFTIQRTVTG